MRGGRGAEVVREGKRVGEEVISICWGRRDLAKLVFVWIKVSGISLPEDARMNKVCIDTSITD